MSETVKHRRFCSEPMGQKLISQVPGVGLIAARKLRSINYIKARDLYNRLKLLGLDANKFRVWIAINCKGAKSKTIYKAFMGYHRQFGDQESDDIVVPRSAPRVLPTDTTTTRVRNTKPLLAARRSRPRNSVQFDLSANNVSASERENDTPVNDTLRMNNSSNDALALFFASFSDLCKDISREFHTELKMEVLSIVAKYEKKSRERQQGQNGFTTLVAENGMRP